MRTTSIHLDLTDTAYIADAFQQAGIQGYKIYRNSVEVKITINNEYLLPAVDTLRFLGLL